MCASGVFIQGEHLKHRTYMRFLHYVYLSTEALVHNRPRPQPGGRIKASLTSGSERLDPHFIQFL